MHWGIESVQNPEVLSEPLSRSRQTDLKPFSVRAIALELATGSIGSLALSYH
jgi:hypothetical protein